MGWKGDGVEADLIRILVGVSSWRCRSYNIHYELGTGLGSAGHDVGINHAECIMTLEGSVWEDRHS